MGCTIDHLSVDHRVKVIQDFNDARRVKHRAGESAVIRRMDLDWARQEIEIEWERDQVRERLFFSLSATTGPRNGRMRDYFELGAREPLPREKPARGRLGAKPPIPQLAEKPVVDVTLYSDAVTRIWALAANQRFVEAEAQIRLVLQPTDPFGGRLEQLAGDLVAIAVAHCTDADGVVYQWARERAVNLWYAWGSGATSGAEGAVRAMSIRAAEEKLAECDAVRRDAVAGA